MKRVGFLTYYFPPVGGGGTPRTVKFVKYLPHHGYRPLVLAVDPTAHDYSREFQPDPTPLAELDPAAYDVLRVQDPATSARWRGVLSSRVYPFLWAGGYRWLYDAQRSWALRAGRELLRLPRNHRPDLIYVSAAPVGALEAGSASARRLGIPWVADLRDLWTCDTVRTFPSRLHFAWVRRFERHILRTAAAIIANTPLSAVRLQELVGARHAQRVVVITNGFDPAEVEAAKARTARPAGAPIVLLHAGTLYDPGVRRPRLGRYFPHAIDDTARSILPLAQALVALREADPALCTRLRIRLMGHTPPDSRRLIASMGLEDQVQCEGTVTREVALQSIADADALIVLQMAWEDPKRPMPYVPGKVYEALASGKPILAPVGPGDLHDLLAQTPQAYVCDYLDTPSVVAATRRLAAALDGGLERPSPPSWLAQFSRVRLAARLAGVFDHVLGEHGGGAPALLADGSPGHASTSP